MNLQDMRSHGLSRPVKIYNRKLQLNFEVQDPTTTSRLKKKFIINQTVASLYFHTTMVLRSHRFNIALKLCTSLVARKEVGKVTQFSNVCSDENGMT